MLPMVGTESRSRGRWSWDIDVRLWWWPIPTTELRHVPNRCSRISFFLTVSHLTRNINRPSSHLIQTRRPSCTWTSNSRLMIRHCNKSMGSWKISLEILTTSTTPTRTRGCDRSTTKMRAATKKARQMFVFNPRFFVDNAVLTHKFL